ncbi:hypothetical protein HN747_04795 [archaeon]|jgi:hypothetical protein|nr:hypothetical protein [archaeon]
MRENKADKNDPLGSSITRDEWIRIEILKLFYLFNKDIAEIKSSADYQKIEKLEEKWNIRIAFDEKDALCIHSPQPAPVSVMLCKEHIDIVLEDYDLNESEDIVLLINTKAKKGLIIDEVSRIVNSFQDELEAKKSMQNLKVSKNNSGNAVSIEKSANILNSFYRDDLSPREIGRKYFITNEDYDYTKDSTNQMKAHGRINSFSNLIDPTNKILGKIRDLPKSYR